MERTYTMNDVKCFLGQRFAEVEEMLTAVDFANTPASIGHHGNYEGGLLDHSISVGVKLAEFTDKLGLTWDEPRSPYVIGVLHDMCKTYNYVKVDGVWCKRTDAAIVGHGAASLQIIQMHGVHLTPAEVMCIRYHMGAYEVNEWNELNAAVAEHPNIIFTHAADMYAAKVDGI